VCPSVSSARPSGAGVIVRLCGAPIRRQSMDRPGPQLIRTFREGGELAAAWMRWMGFEDAHVTIAGADGGIDVVSEQAVAQVKVEGSPSGRPAVQALFGIAAADGRQGLFFSLAGWTAEALSW